MDRNHAFRGGTGGGFVGVGGWGGCKGKRKSLDQIVNKFEEEEEGKWLSLSLFLSCALALLGKLHEACVPAKPPAPAHLCPSTCPFARLLLGVDRGTCWGLGFCDPATIELRVGTIIAIVVQPGRVFGD